MAPRRKISPSESSGKNPVFRKPGGPTLTLPSPEPTSTRIYYPETQLENMESGMRPRGGFVDRGLASFLGTDKGFTTVKIQPKPIPEPNIDPPSEKTIESRWNEFAAKEREYKEQSEEKEKEEKYLRHHYPRRRPDHSFEDGMTLDTDRDLALTHSSSAAKESRETSDDADSMAAEGATKERLGRRSKPQWYTLMAPNTEIDVKPLLPAPESSSPSYELRGIDSLVHNQAHIYQQQHPLSPPRPYFTSINCSVSHSNLPHTPKVFLTNPFLWVALVGMIYIGYVIYRGPNVDINIAKEHPSKRRQRSGRDRIDKHAFCDRSALECEAGCTVDEMEFYNELGYVISEKDQTLYPASHVLLDERDGYHVSYVLDEDAYPATYVLEEEETAGFEMEMRVVSGLFPGEDI
jgi:hypothetical protein